MSAVNMRIVTLASASRVCSCQIYDSIALRLNRSGILTSHFGTVVVAEARNLERKVVLFLPFFL